MFKVIVTPEATEELFVILDISYKRFGYDAANRYRLLVENAKSLLARNPELPFTIKFPSLSTEIRGLPLWLVPQPDKALRVKNPPHIIYYRIVDDKTVEILRIFHKGMNRTSILQLKN